MKHLFKTALALFLLLMVDVLHAQDVIVKTDKTEIKSKVTEITETNVKYRKWDHLDGPVYNIDKADVFMIIYANGQREVIKTQTATTAKSTSEQNMQSTTSSTSDLASALKQSNSTVDTSIDYKSLKLKYKPTRLNASLQAPFSIGTNYEFRVVKNIFNIGFAYDYIVVSNPYIVSDNFGFVYGSFYLPLNRMMQNYKDQDKGLFVFAHLGYGYTYLQEKDFDGKVVSVSSGAFTWRVGADYFISQKFGLTLSSYQFKTAYAGFAFRL